MMSKIEYNIEKTKVIFTTPDDGLLLASRLSYNWVVLGCRQ
jgi:hypothetical protein